MSTSAARQSCEGHANKQGSDPGHQVSQGYRGVVVMALDPLGYK